jgi:hypothetical protein
MLLSKPFIGSLEKKTCFYKGKTNDWSKMVIREEKFTSMKPYA